VDTKGFLLNPWGSDVVTTPEHLKEVVPLAKGAQVLNLIRENQLITAVIVFILWQAGALQSGIGLIGGVC